MSRSHVSSKYDSQHYDPLRLACARFDPTRFDPANRSSFIFHYSSICHTYFFFHFSYLFLLSSFFFRFLLSACMVRNSIGVGGFASSVPTSAQPAEEAVSGSASGRPAKRRKGGKGETSNGSPSDPELIQKKLQKDTKSKVADWNKSMLKCIDETLVFWLDCQYNPCTGSTDDDLTIMLERLGLVMKGVTDPAAFEKLPSNFDTFFSSGVEKYVKKHTHQEMMTADMEAVQKFAADTVSKLKAHYTVTLTAETEYTKAVQTDLATIAEEMATLDAKVDASTAGDIAAALTSFKNASLNIATVLKTLAAQPLRVRAAADAIKSDVQEEKNRSKKAQRDKEKQLKLESPEFKLKKEQDAAIRTKIPLCLAHKDLEVSDSDGGLEQPRKFVLCEEGKQVCDSAEMAAFFMQVRNDGPNRDQFKEKNKLTALIKTPAVPDRLADALLTSVERHLSAGVVVAKPDGPGIGSRLRQKLAVTINAPGYDFSAGFGGAPFFAILLPGGGNKTIAMVAAGSVSRCKDEKGNPIPFDHEGLQRGLLSDGSARWVKMHAYDGVYVPPGSYLKDVTVGQNALTLRIYLTVGQNALTMESLAAAESLAAISPVMRDTEVETNRCLLAMVKPTLAFKTDLAPQASSDPCSKTVAFQTSTTASLKRKQPESCVKELCGICSHVGSS
jgi:hypothetical protein